MSPPSEPIVQIEGLTKRYGSQVGLDALSLTVGQGEILALVGPNGAGKTTALKLMVGLLSPTAGSVRVGGFEVERQPLEAKRLVSFVPDQPFLYESLTVAEFLGFIGSIYRLLAEALRQRAEELSGLLGLRDQLGRRISELSYGTKSRLVLVAALIREPRVLIMDEPFFGLDPQTLRLIKQLLRERVARGMTVILSTHQLAIVEDLASRIAILTAGKLRELGSLRELSERHGAGRLEELFFQLPSSP
jgi:ABC-2 type transport system ATP-binding protein